MAWQMAMMHHGILSTILEIAANWQDIATNQVDHNPVWRRLYLRGILNVRLNKPQDWVIDSLDECKGASELVAFLTRAQEYWPLCLLVTSRVPINTYMGTTNPTIDIVSETILEEDTNQDIALFLKANLDSLPSPTSLGRKAMAEEILQASNGCFFPFQQSGNNVHPGSIIASGPCLVIRQELDDIIENMNVLFVSKS
ncbi:hypothetical protein VTN00DRAFT_9025 [Thermoascus crustaceus]|uniref:uncharacterized protein n=1 Tax=Thermoascus crustaceus TaxID=5088 RepID=UPI003741F471